MLKHSIALIGFIFMGVAPMMAQAEPQAKPQTELSAEDKQKVAEGACECLSPISGLAETARALENEADEKKIKEYIEQVTPLVKESIQCMDKLANQYPAAENADEKEMSALMRKICPEVAEAMEL